MVRESEDFKEFLFLTSPSQRRWDSISPSTWGFCTGENRVHIILGCRESQAAASSEGPPAPPPPPPQKDLWKQPRHSELHHRELWAKEPAVLILMQNCNHFHFHRMVQLPPTPKPPDSVMSGINRSYVSCRPVSLSPCSTGSSLHPSPSTPPQRSPGFPTKAHEICTKMTHPDGCACFLLHMHSCHTVQILSSRSQETSGLFRWAGQMGNYIHCICGYMFPSMVGQLVPVSSHGMSK